MKLTRLAAIQEQRALPSQLRENGSPHAADGGRLIRDPLGGSFQNKAVKESMRRFLFAITLFVYVAFVAACSNEQTTTPTKIPFTPTSAVSPTPIPPTKTPLPTITPTRTPLPTSTPTPTEYPYSTLPGWFAYIDFDCEGLCTNISIIKPDVSGRKLLTNHDHGLATSVLWSPNGRFIAYQFIVLGEQGGLELRLFDLKTNKMSILTPKYIEPISGLSWSPDSRYIVIGYQNESGKSGKIQRVDIQNHQVVNLTKDLLAQDVSPVWSPDGKVIAFSAKNSDGAETTSSIWLMDANGSNLRNLTSDSGEKWQSLLPSWSPDGRRIAFYRQGDKSATGLWIMGADGSDQHLLYEIDSASAFEIPVWSPDGNYIAFIYGDKDQTEVRLLNTKTGVTLTISDPSGKYTGLSWSPDSQALIFMQQEGEFERHIHLFVFDRDNPIKVSSQTSMEGPVWSPVAELP